MSLGARKPTKNNRNMLLAAIGLAVAVLLLAAILAAGIALYLLTSGRSMSTTALTTNTARTTTSTATTTKATTITIPGTGISSLRSSTTTTQETLPSEPTTSEVVIPTTEESTSPTGISSLQSSTTTLLDMSEVAACLNGKGVKLFVNDACLNQPYGGCKSIQKSFGLVFDQLFIVNCNLEDNEEECDNAREERETSLAFPLWYVGLTGEYYPGVNVMRIRAVTGC